MSQRQRRRHHDATRVSAVGSGTFLEGPAAAVLPVAARSNHAAISSSPTAASARQWRLLHAGLLLDELSRVQQLREMAAGEQTEGGGPAAPADWRRLRLEEEWRRGQSQRRILIHGAASLSQRRARALESRMGGQNRVGSRRSVDSDFIRSAAAPFAVSAPAVLVSSLHPQRTKTRCCSGWPAPHRSARRAAANSWPRRTLH